MKLLRYYKVRLLPNMIQRRKLKEFSGVQRFIWNNLLAYCINRYDKYDKEESKSYYIKKKDILKWNSEFGKLITFCKKEIEDYQWLNDVSRHTISQIQRDLMKAYKKFFKFQETNEFKKEFGKEKYNYKHHPKFKSKKDNKISIPFDANDVYYDGNGCIQFPKLGKIKIKTKYNLPIGNKLYAKGEKNYLFNPRIKLINNKWILCFVMEIESQDVHLNKDLVIGIDLGIKELCVATNINENDKIYKNINKVNKKIKRLEKKLVLLNRCISRKYRTFKRLFPNKKFERSKSFQKIVLELQKVYYHLCCIRRNYLHHVSHEIISQNAKIICLEDLDLNFMIKNHKLAKAELNQCLGLFRQMICYKAEEVGTQIILADKTYPSTQLCSFCGSRQHMELSDRTYKCEKCGLVLDRDINAARNLELYGREFLDSY